MALCSVHELLRVLVVPLFSVLLEEVHSFGNIFFEIDFTYTML